MPWMALVQTMTIFFLVLCIVLLVTAALGAWLALRVRRRRRERGP